MHILLATPCFGCMVTEGYLKSVVSLFNHCSQFKIPIDLMTWGGDALITKARSGLVAKFLSGNYTHLLFVDADIEFHYDSVIQLLKRDKDVIAGLYPKKKYHFNNKECSEFKLVHYPFLPLDEIAKDGLLRVKNVAAGFMLIKRNVIEKMIPTCTKYSDGGVRGDGDFKNHYYNLFDTQIIDGNYVSEDYAFCNRWRDLGGEIWVDLTVNLNHIGPNAFRGNPLTSLTTQSFSS